MLKFVIATAVLAALLLTNRMVGAEEPPKWSVGAQASYVVMGSDGRRMTGGLMPSVNVLRRFEVGENKTIAVGANLGVFGLSGNVHWLGVLTGPMVSLTKHWTLPYSWGQAGLGGSIASDFGRVPTCNAWSPALCMRFWGWFPALGVHAAYDTGSHSGVVISYSARFVRTLVWSGISSEPKIEARWSW